MNYTIIGQDGKKYGPASAEQVRQWISQGRVNGGTPVIVEGMTEWTFVGLRPEFATQVPGAPPTITAPAGAGGSIKTTNQLATWGMICGILSWALCCCCVPFNITGLVLSIVALAQIQAHPQTQEGRGYAIAGIVLSATNLLWAFGLTLANLANAHTNVVWPIDPN